MAHSVIHVSSTMKVFITGGTGLQGSYLIPLLLADGHQVVALTRSASSAEKAKQLGAEAVMGTVQDLDILDAQATHADAVFHLAFDGITTLKDFARACADDRAAITTMCDALLAAGKPDATFIYASGTLMTDGENEESRKTPNPGMPRYLSEELVVSYASPALRSLAVRLPPVVHAAHHRHPFIASQISAAKAHGYAGYVDVRDKTSSESAPVVWPSVHAQDAARVYVKALDPSGAPNGTTLHAVAEPEIPVRDVAQLIADKLGVEVQAVPAEKAMEHFGFTGAVLQMSNRYVDVFCSLK